MTKKKICLLVFMISIYTTASAQDVMTEFGKMFCFFKPDLKGDVLSIEEREYLVFNTNLYPIEKIDEAFEELDPDSFEGLNREDYIFIGDVNSINSEADLKTKPLYRTNFDFPTRFELHERNYHRDSLPIFSEGDIYFYNEEGWCTSAKYCDDVIRFEFENTIVDNLLVSRKGTMSFNDRDTGKLVRLAVDGDFEWIKPHSRFNVTNRIQNKVRQVEEVLIKEEDVYEVRYFWDGDLTHTLDRKGEVFEFKWYKKDKFVRELTIIEENTKVDDTGNWLVRKRMIRGNDVHYDKIYVRNITYR